MGYELVTMATENDDAERVRGLLRSVRYPGFKRDIVAAGFVKDIEAEGKRVTVHFARLCQTKFARRQNADGRDSQAISSHHSARAAARFCLKISRRLRWRS